MGFVLLPFKRQTYAPISRSIVKHRSARRPTCSDWRNFVTVSFSEYEAETCVEGNCAPVCCTILRPLLRGDQEAHPDSPNQAALAANAELVLHTERSGDI